jgi:hypothetical protein
MSGELLLITKLKARSSAVSVFCCSGKLLKQMALRSAVAKGTLGGYKISISGLPYIDVEVANNKCYRPVLEACGGESCIGIHCLA